MICRLVQAEGGIPSNTADLLKEQEFAQKVTVADHEDVEGMVNSHSKYRGLFLSLQF